MTNGMFLLRVTSSLPTFLPLALMVKHARSNLQTRIVTRKGIEKSLQEAIEYINGKKATNAKLGKKRPSTASLLNEFSQEHADKLTPTQRTVHRHLKDKDAKTKAQAAADQQTLNNVEELTLVALVQTLAARAFPLGRRRIMRYALEIARIRHPNLEKISESWFRRFQSRHPQKLKAAWSKSLNTSRAAAVNPTTIAHYFQLLKVTLEQYNFTPKEIYGFDESGFPFGGDGVNERVYGGGRSVQHKQDEGNKENVSVMVTICADGTYTTPTAIFKAVHYNSAWAEILNDRELKLK
jgi:hypothetical protein